MVYICDSGGLEYIDGAMIMKWAMECDGGWRMDEKEKDGRSEGKGGEEGMAMERKVRRWSIGKRNNGENRMGGRGRTRMGDGTDTITNPKKISQTTMIRWV